MSVLASSNAYATIPATDLARAKSFYADKLGLQAAVERSDGLLYRCGESQFLLFESNGKASGSHTQLGWEVEDVEATVAALRDKGVTFEEYDLPGLKTEQGIAQFEGEKVAWFKDSEGNLLAIGRAQDS